MQLLLVPPDRLSHVWPHIEADLAKVLCHADFDAETFAQMVRGGQVLLALMRKDRRYAGLAAFKVEGSNLHIVVVACKGGLACLGALEVLAREMGMQSISFGSPRRGWHRLAPKAGFEEVGTLYRKKL